MVLQSRSAAQGIVCAAWLKISVFLFSLLLLGNFLSHSISPVPSVRANQSSTISHEGGYAGSEACARCHKSIYDHYMQTGMGRSISNITPQLLQQLHLPSSFFDDKANRHYEIYAQQGILHESEFETDAAGGEVFGVTRPLRWVVGAGAYNIAGIVQVGEYLFEAPLALYTNTMTWGHAPGYEFADYAFSRPILPGCIACHTGRANPVPDSSGRYEAVPFSEMAIGCERCHGPGAAHVQAMQNSGAGKGAGSLIVNPARLTPALANDICLACHEIGDERVLQPGKTYQDIRPGAPLGETLSVFMVPPTRNSPPQSDHLQHYYSMMLSKCYRASGGRLRCISCHDPHVELASQDKATAYNLRCGTCHTDSSCGLPLAKRSQGTPPDNCIGCHMPRRSVSFIAHTSLTNHRIVARPEEPLPDAAFGQTTTALPDLINLAPLPGKEDAPPALLTLLRAYGELAPDHPEYNAAYLKTLDRLEKTQPDHALVQAALGRLELRNGNLALAVDHLQRALQLGPRQASTLADLSQAFDRLGRPSEAFSALQSAIELDPYNPVLQKTQIVLFIRQKRYTEARAAMDHYLGVFPQDSLMRRMRALSRGEARQQ